MSQFYFVQFIHPGGEHTPQKRDLKNGINRYDWNYKEHRRKFMKVSGQYVNYNDILSSGEIYFWGEWEPWSIVNSIAGPIPLGDYPHFIHHPIYDFGVKHPPFINAKYPPTDKKDWHRQNTDPFVFGNNFFYSLCQQSTSNGNSTKMTRLAPGSIILFGSCKHDNSNNAYFALDTVFVVSDRRDYSPNTYKKDLSKYIPNNYDNIMGFKYWPNQSDKLVSYKGASFANQFEGMYSFVPCKTDGAGGFERAKLTQQNFNLISNNLSQRFKANASTIEDNIKLWNALRAYLRNKGYLEGVSMNYTIIP